MPTLKNPLATLQASLPLKMYGVVAAVCFSLFFLSSLVAYPVRFVQHSHPCPPPSWPFEPVGSPVLFIFPPSKQAITSLDVECVKYQAFLAFSNYAHVTRECHEPGMSPSGKLPFLITAEGKILTGRQIIEEVKNTAGDLESRLTELERSKLTALTLLAEAKLDFALLFTLWYDPRVRDTVTLPLHEALYPWPLNKILSRQLRAEKTEWMLSRKSVLKKDEILSEAKQTLAALSTLLGSQLFFFGSKASFLDAVVFSYLHIILSLLSLPGAEVPLREAALRHDNLVQYARRVFNTFFAS